MKLTVMQRLSIMTLSAVAALLIVGAMGVFQLGKLGQTVHYINSNTGTQ
jgi:hypothetical protein